MKIGADIYQVRPVASLVDSDQLLKFSSADFRSFRTRNNRVKIKWHRTKAPPMQITIK